MSETKQLAEITLWKNNRTDGEFKMTIQEFEEKFFAWLRTREKSWCNYYGSRAAVNEFIGKELHSVVDFKPEESIDVYGDISIIVQDEFWSIVETELA